MQEMMKGGSNLALELILLSTNNVVLLYRGIQDPRTSLPVRYQVAVCTGGTREHHYLKFRQLSFNCVFPSGEKRTVQRYRG
jgi:hypothetical protein